MSIPIYIIDDEPAILKALKQLLSIEGYEAEVFGDAREALKKLDRDWPGVVLSDINMPGIDGVEFLREVLKVDSTSSTSGRLALYLTSMPEASMGDASASAVSAGELWTSKGPKSSRENVDLMKSQVVWM